MNTGNVYSHIHIDEQSITPKYRQLTDSIVKGIESGSLKKDYLLPSINALSDELDISRDTAEKAYRNLKNIGILGSIPGKGYFIANTDLAQSFKIFLLFNKLSEHKKIIYDSLVSALGDKAAIDFFIYNNDFAQFKKLLNEKKNDYTHFVIIPHFLKGEEKTHEVINEINGGNLILLDKKIAGITRQFGGVFQNFEKDIFTVLQQARPKLEKYKTIKIIFPSFSYYPVEILKGFIYFCSEYNYNYSVVHSIKEEPINEGDIYINLMEDDLALLLDNIQQTNLKVGKDVGIISYNETPLKRFILDGITTISTNFKEMGAATARMILNNDISSMEVPFTLTLRPSL